MYSNTIILNTSMVVAIDFYWDCMLVSNVDVLNDVHSSLDSSDVSVC